MNPPVKQRRGQLDSHLEESLALRERSSSALGAALICPVRRRRTRSFMAPRVSRGAQRCTPKSSCIRARARAGNLPLSLSALITRKWFIRGSHCFSHANRTLYASLAASYPLFPLLLVTREVCRSTAPVALSFCTIWSTNLHCYSWRAPRELLYI